MANEGQLFGTLWSTQRSLHLSVCFFFIVNFLIRTCTYYGATGISIVTKYVRNRYLPLGLLLSPLHKCGGGGANLFVHKVHRQYTVPSQSTTMATATASATEKDINVDTDTYRRTTVQPFLHILSSQLLADRPQNPLTYAHAHIARLLSASSSSFSVIGTGNESASDWKASIKMKAPKGQDSQPARIENSLLLNAGPSSAFRDSLFDDVSFSNSLRATAREMFDDANPAASPAIATTVVTVNEACRVLEEVLQVKLAKASSFTIPCS